MLNKFLLFISFATMVLISGLANAADSAVKAATEAGATESRTILILAVLFALSELLASFSKIKGNSIFQLIKQLIEALYNSMKEKK